MVSTSRDRAVLLLHLLLGSSPIRYGIKGGILGVDAVALPCHVILWAKVIGSVNHVRAEHAVEVFLVDADLGVQDSSVVGRKAILDNYKWTNRKWVSHQSYRSVQAEQTFQMIWWKTMNTTRTILTSI